MRGVNVSFVICLSLVKKEFNQYRLGSKQALRILSDSYFFKFRDLDGVIRGFVGL